MLSKLWTLVEGGTAKKPATLNDFIELVSRSCGSSILNVVAPKLEKKKMRKYAFFMKQIAMDRLRETIHVSSILELAVSVALYNVAGSYVDVNEACIINLCSVEFFFDLEFGNFIATVLQKHRSGNPIDENELVFIKDTVFQKCKK